ncbi:MAG: VanW family protein [Candidatus Phosphoribacter sp.]|nr:VanW family protein [Actinomycetales bacterium]
MPEWGRIALRSLLAVVVLCGVYLGLAWWTGRQVPSQVVVEGVSIGGLGPEEAVERLTRELADTAKAPIRVDLADTGTSIALEPSSAGLSIDIPGTLDGLVGFTLDPTKIWGHLSGRVERPVRVVVDEPRLTAALTEKARAVETPVAEGGISLAAGKVVTTPARPGVALSVSDAVRKVSQGWPRVPSVTADVTTTQPTVSQARLDEAVRTFATPAMSGPITIVVGERSATLTPDQFSGAITMAADSAGAIAPVFDKEALTGAVVAATSGMITPAKDARIILEGGNPVVQPSVDGVGVDTAQAADLLIGAMVSPTRKITLPSVLTKATFTTEAAQALGVKQIVATFDSAFPANADRTVNLTTAANTINGTLIKPGEVFSLNGVLGERTAAKGYREAGMILNGRLVQATGGGVSQISTVVYNLAWFAGVELTQHQAHSFYISRYPAGREATVNWPTIDNKWTNTTPYGILVQMWVSGGQVHGRLWSTKLYDVEAVAGPRTNPRPGKVITDTQPGCVPQNSLVAGFDITVKRVIRQGGAVLKTESYTTKYDSENKIVCAAR